MMRFQTTKIHSLICWTLLVSLLHWAVAPHCLQAQQSNGRLVVTSEPEGLAVYVDDRLVGQTPVEDYTLPEGPHTVRVVRPEGAAWDILDWQRDVSVPADETIRSHAVFVGPVVVMSSPFDAEVYMNNLRMGTTPLRLSNLPPGPYTVTLRKAGYQEASRSFVVRDTVHQTFQVELMPDNPEMAGASGYSQPIRSNHKLQNVLGYATLGLGVLFTGLALNSDRKADRAYGRYLNTADPIRSEQFFQQAARQDRRTSSFAVAAQVNFAGAFYFFISHAFRSKE